MMGIMEDKIRKAKKKAEADSAPSVNFKAKHAEIDSDHSNTSSDTYGIESVSKKRRTATRSEANFGGGMARRKFANMVSARYGKGK